jgi:hypothetical protein
LTLTGYHQKALELSSELVAHGYGELTVRVTSLKDDKVKIEVLCGKSFVYFVKKNIPFRQRDDLI